MDQANVSQDNCSPLPLGLLDEILSEMFELPGYRLSRDEPILPILKSTFSAFLKLTPTTQDSIAFSETQRNRNPKRQQTQITTELQDLIFQNLTTTEYITSLSDVYSLIKASRLPNLVNLFIYCNKHGESEPIPTDFWDVVQSLPNLTSLYVRLTTSSDEPIPNSNLYPLFKSITSPFSLPELKHLHIAPELLNKSALRLICQYWSFPALTNFTDNITDTPRQHYHVFNCQRSYSIHQLLDDEEINQGLVQWFESLPRFKLLAPARYLGLGLPLLFAKRYILSKELLSRETELPLLTDTNAEINHLLVSSPHLETITSIEIEPWDEQSEVDIAEVARLVAKLRINPSLANVTDFKLSNLQLTAPIAEALAQPHYLTNIARFAFINVTFRDSVAFQTLFHSPFVSNLQEIDCFSSPNLTNDHLQIISTSPYLTNLKRLYLSDGNGRSRDLYDSQGLDYLKQSSSIPGKFNNITPGLVVWNQLPTDTTDDVDENAAVVLF